MNDKDIVQCQVRDVAVMGRVKRSYRELDGLTGPPDDQIGIARGCRIQAVVLGPGGALERHFEDGGHGARLRGPSVAGGWDPPYSSR